MLEVGELDRWEALLDRLGVSRHSRIQIARRAQLNGVAFLQELHVSGVATETDIHRALAEELGIEFLESIDPDRLIIPDRDCITLLGRPVGAAQVGFTDKQSICVIMDTRRLDVERAKDWLRRSPELADRLKIAAPFTLRSALFKRAGSTLVSGAVSRLADSRPDHSARIVANAWQGFVLGTVAAALPVILFVAPFETLLGLHLFFTIFFFACVVLRFAAIAWAVPAVPFVPASLAAEDLPIYSVLIALHKEAEIIPDLLEALDAIVWPRSKLEIKLVCEADDHTTLAAIRAHTLSPMTELIEVPVFGPRTKPKALAYALPASSGEYVVLYDAEDRPHPLQLIEAWQRFQHGGPKLACVQAPLDISNANQSAIARLFAFEYAALFRGMLPWLSARRLLMPLGGTSNHFRRTVLEEVGGWDPYNVTEDADLGLRLARFGYHAETISSPTQEDGPEDLATWLPQRARWLKGWLQTWIVHMRHPRKVAGELSYGSLAVLHVLFSGILLSAIAYPLFFLSAIILVVYLALGNTLSTFASVLLAIDIVNISCGYLSFLLLGWQVQSSQERQDFIKVVLYTPVYWLLISAAAICSVKQLILRPHHWDKTTHKRPRSAAGGAGGQSEVLL